MSIRDDLIADDDIQIDEIARNLEAYSTALDIHTRRHEILYETNRILSEAGDIALAMDGVLRVICDGLGWEWSCLWTIDSSANALRCAHIWQRDRVDLSAYELATRTISFPLGVGYPGRVWNSSEPIWIADIQQADGFLRRDQAIALGLHSGIWFPVKSAHQALGVMEFMNTKIEVPDRGLLAVMGAIGRQVGQYFELLAARELSEQRAQDLEVAHRRLREDLDLKLEANRRLSVQHAVAKVLAEATDLQKIGSHIIGSICDCLGWQCGMLWGLAPGGEQLQYLEGWHVADNGFPEFFEASRKLRFHAGRGLIGRVWQNSRPEWVLDIQNDPTFLRADAARCCGLHAAFAFPIRLNNKVIGVLDFFSTTAQEPDHGLLAMMSALGSQIGQFIARKSAEQRAEELLHVILPKRIVEELTINNRVRPRRHEKVAVVFCDIVGFTQYCNDRSPEEIVSNLQRLTDQVEAMYDKHGVSKIKMIGDCIMAASGLLDEVERPVENALRFAEEFITTVARVCPEWAVRTGVHVGPVVSGVLGRHSLQFDMWGDTVNVAARLQNLAEPGTIVLTPDAFQHVADRSFGHSLGSFAVKGKGDLEIFRFDGWRPGAIA